MKNEDDGVGGMAQPSVLFVPEIKNQSGEPWAKDGLELWRQAKFDEAALKFREGLTACPYDHELWTLTGALYGVMGDHQRALNCHKRALEIKPGAAVSLYGLSACFGNMGFRSLALKYALRALDADPNFAPARDAVAVAYQKCFQMPEAIKEYQELLLKEPNNEGALSHLCLASIYMPETTPESLYITHRYYGEVAEQGKVESTFDNVKDPDKKIRVGFFSGDFKTHSVAYFMETLIRDLDRTKFEVYLYYFGDRFDAYTERFKSYAQKWTVLRAHSAKLPDILGDKLDVAFDLGGHTSHHLTLFAHRIAPVQIVYMGYPSTTGLTRMDYRFTDSLADPVGEADKWHTEKLVRLDPNSWTYRPHDDSPEVRPPPCIKNGFITFGSFNNFSKMSDGWLKLWVRILDAVPNSKILLKSFGLNDSDINPIIKARLDSLGFGARVIIHGAIISSREHLDSYGEMDIALDPHPFNGAATTCEALYMGVPVVTMAGNRHAARVGVALMDAIARKEWIAKDEDEYVEIATRLASRPVNLERMRMNQRRVFTSSVLMDYHWQAWRFGNAIRKCWQDYCSK